MEPQNNQENLQPLKPTSIYPWIVTILIAAWIIAIGILGAGWLISKELSYNDSLSVDEPQINTPLEVEIPDNITEQGNRDSKVTVIEFADFQCPFCGQWQKEIYSKLKAEYIDNGKIRFIFWDFAFLGEESNKAAEAALCAKDQNRYWEYHDKLYANQNGENQGAFSDLNLKKFAKEIELNTEGFNSCLDKRQYQSKVQELNLKASHYGVSSTPTVFINGLKFEGIMAYENYKQIIDSELAK